MKYPDICEAKTKEEMQSRFAQHLKDCAEHFGGTPESHAKIQLANIGYFAGYYNPQTSRNVMEWLGAIHPIFGPAIVSVTPEEALRAGANAAEAQAKEG